MLELFQSGKLNGTTHTCLGQEYIPVAVMPLLRDDDFVFSNHRGHGHYLARFRDPAGLLAEITGREGAVNRGVGGSQHIKRGRYLSTGVQGESLPVAVGAALQLKREGCGAIAAPFIGDGTWGEGAVYEALNMAALWQVPLVVFVENNGIAQSTPRDLNLAGTIEARVRAFGVEYVRCTGHDVAMLRRELGPAIERTRRECTPLVVEFETRRLASHSKGDDTRDAAAIEALRAASWLADAEAQYPEELARADAGARKMMAELLPEVMQRPLSNWRS